MTQLKDNIFSIEVPEDAEYFKIDGITLVFSSNESSTGVFMRFITPFGKWQIIGTPLNFSIGIIQGRYRAMKDLLLR